MTNLKGVTIAKALYRVVNLIAETIGNSVVITDSEELGTIQLPVCPTRQEIVKALKEQEYLVPRLHAKSFDIDGNSQRFVISDNRKENYIPCYELVKVNTCR